MSPRIVRPRNVTDILPHIGHPASIKAYQNSTYDPENFKRLARGLGRSPHKGHFVVDRDIRGPDSNRGKVLSGALGKVACSRQTMEAYVELPVKPGRGRRSSLVAVGVEIGDLPEAYTNGETDSIVQHAAALAIWGYGSGELDVLEGRTTPGKRIPGNREGTVVP